MNPALIVIDMQNFFYNQNPAVFHRKLLPNIKASLSLARASKIPIIHVVTIYRSDESDMPKTENRLLKVRNLKEGAKDAQIIEEVKPLEGERVVIKTRFSGFYNSILENVLRGLNVDTLFIAGYANDVCVRMTVLDAYNRDYRMFLLSDCVNAAREDTEISIRYLQWLTDLKVISYKEMTGIWESKKEDIKVLSDYISPKYDPDDTLFVTKCTRNKIWDEEPDAPDFVLAKNAYRDKKLDRFISWFNDNNFEKKGFFWVILSAKYGFLEPEHPISRYRVTFRDPATGPISDRTLKGQIKQTRYWRSKQGDLVKTRIMDFHHIICVNFNGLYLETIKKCLPDANVALIKLIGPDEPRPIKTLKTPLWLVKDIKGNVNG